MAAIDEPVSDSDVEELATFVIKWEDLRPYLGLDRAKEVEIKNLQTDYRGEKRECIEAWREKEGNKATYRAFVAAAEAAKQQSLADKVMAMLRNREYERMVAHHGLTADQLHTICSDDVLHTLAPQMKNLKFEPESGVVDDIDWQSSVDVDEEGKRQIWKEIYGHAPTYERLVRNFIASDRSDLADSVCKACKQVIPSAVAPDKDTAVTSIATKESQSRFSQFFSLPDGNWVNWFNQTADEKIDLVRNLERNRERVKFLTEQKEEKEKRIENLQNEAQQMRTALEEERRRREEAQKDKEILENGIHQEKEEKGEKLTELEKQLKEERDANEKIKDELAQATLRRRGQRLTMTTICTIMVFLSAILAGLLLYGMGIIQ